MIEPKNVVITGSSRGIGFALANEFLKAGCRVMLSGKSGEHLTRALDGFKAYKDFVFAQRCDVTRTADLEGLWRAAKERLATIDIWINNAGIGQGWLPIWDVDAEKARAIVETNVIGLIHGSQIAFKGLRAQGQGQPLDLRYDQARAPLFYGGARAGGPRFGRACRRVEPGNDGHRLCPGAPAPRPGAARA
jgi:NAD(P)-dependent dehydrogenase (short-subunit alcohol dehydrogenase family)